MKGDFHYFRDSDPADTLASGAWGVRNSHTGRVVGRSMDKTDALVIALFLDGETADAVKLRDDFRRYYKPEEITR